MKVTRVPKEIQARSFIGKAQKPVAGDGPRNITLRFDPGILDRAGVAAARLGISRNAFFSLAAVAKLEEMGA